ncbi:MAG: Type III restriction-modification system methylation subunit [Ktedonobacterales bacterium]|jgi:DNA modification methylase|nr:MAG: Type III restriction-modification system methylation subunit [Ktedonobacterales bacterium]
MTELVWDGKYDTEGKRTAPVRIPLPFQTIETVNESGAVRAHQLDLFAQGRPTDWRNRLIWGDKKYVLPSLLPEFAGKVNLIYIDPPFATGANFSFTATIPEAEESFTKEPSLIEQKAYRDTWGQGIDSYLQWFSETALLLRELLTSNGTIFVHVGWQVSSAVRLVLDETFGADWHLNEIIWKRTPHAGSSKARSNKLPVNHECIYWYAKGDGYTYHHQYTPYEQEYIDRFSNPDSDPRGPWQSVALRTYSQETFDKLKAANMLIPPQREGAGWRYKWFLSETKGKQIEDIWTDISAANSMANERLDYPTQKPEALLERIVRASSNEGDLVLDCFCGSGTTAAVAEKLGRRWITADLGRFAIATTRKRLLSIENVQPFCVQNLGKYERQAWQVAEFAAGDVKQAPQTQLAYRRFMLDLYRAQPLDGYTWLHGLRDGRLVHIGSVDAPVALGDVQNIVKEVWKVRGQGLTNSVDVLGWDFAFEMHETASQMAAQANVQVRFKRIPREVLEKKAVEQGDIKFFELAALDAHISQRASDAVDAPLQDCGPHVTVTLTDFTVPPDDIPDDVQQAVKHWSQWIDYWAVDWDYQGDAFHNMAQTFRTRKQPQLQTRLAHSYDQPGSYTIVVKVIDILGNDTTKTLKVEVR